MYSSLSIRIKHNISITIIIITVLLALCRPSILVTFHVVLVRHTSWHCASSLSRFSVHRKVFATTKAWRYDDDERPVYKSPELLARNGGHFHLCPLKTANTLASWTDWACKLSDCSGKIGWFDNTPTVWVSFVSTSPWIFISASYYRWSSSSLVRCNFPVFTWTMWKLVWLSSGSGNEVRGGWPQMGGL